MEKQHDYYAERESDKEISVKSFFDVIKNGVWIILAITALSTIGGYLLGDNHTLLYQSSTRVIIGSDSEYMKTLMVMIKDPLVMEEVKSELELSRSSESIADQIEVMKIDESQVVKITVTDPDPALAVAIANATAGAFKSKVIEILDFSQVQLLSAAKESNVPINENQNRTVVIALVFGLIAGIGLVFVLDSLDETVKNDREIEAVLGVPVLGAVTKIKVKNLKSKNDSKLEQQLEIGSDIGEFK
jgi:capsular polysaccharide biosynthesis protein